MKNILEHAFTVENLLFGTKMFGDVLREVNDALLGIVMIDDRIY